MNTSYSVYLSLIESSGIVTSLFKEGNGYDVIVCYHDISSDDWEFSITPELFGEHINTLNEKFDVVSLDRILETDNTSGKVRVAITFDDGYEGVYKYALPIMEKHGVTGTVFVLGNSEVDPENSVTTTFLTPDEIKELSDKGWIIGWHTNSHKDVSDLSEDDFENEVRIAKEKMESNLGIKIEYFAYPYGIYSESAVQNLKNKGYKAAFTVDGDKVNKKDPLTVSRITISKYMTPEHLINLLNPAGIFINKLFTKLWRVKDNLTK